MKRLISTALLFLFGQGVTADPLTIELKPGGTIAPHVMEAWSRCMAARAPLGRQFSVGDEAVFQVRDLFSNVKQTTLVFSVTRADAQSDRVELNDGAWVMNRDGNFIKTPDSGVLEAVQEMTPTELFVGKSWTATWHEGRRRRGRLDMRVAAIEKISVPAGEFDAFRIEGRGLFGHYSRMERSYWVVPGLNFPLRFELLLVGRHKGIYEEYIDAERYELISLRQQRLEFSCDAALAPRPG